MVNASLLIRASRAASPRRQPHITTSPASAALILILLCVERFAASVIDGFNILPASPHAEIVPGLTLR